MPRRLSAAPKVEDHIGLRIYCPRCAESRETHIQEPEEMPADQHFETGGLENAACGHCGANFGVCKECGFTTGTPGTRCANGHNPETPAQEEEPTTEEAAEIEPTPDPEPEAVVTAESESSPVPEPESRPAPNP